MMNKAIFFLGIFFLISCSNNEDDITPSVDNSISKVSATINGIERISEGDFYNTANRITNSISETKFISILSANDDLSSLRILLPFDANIGSYTFNSTNDSGYAYFMSKNGVEYFSYVNNAYITINITEISIENKLISGTFSANLFGSGDSGSNIVIENGVFKSVKLYDDYIYSNGFVSLQKNNEDTCTMDSDPSDKKYLRVYESNYFPNNMVRLYAVNDDFPNSYYDDYTIFLPKNIMPGTYDISTTQNIEFYYKSIKVLNGSLTIIQNSNKNLIGTFNYISNNSNSTTSISNGNFDITYL